MRFLRVGPAGFERPTALGAEGAAYGLTPLTADVDGALPAGHGTDRLRTALAEDTVLVPRTSRTIDHEIALSVVISRTARSLGSPDAAAGVIAGCAVADVVSERSFQHERAGRGPRTRLWGGGVEVAIDRLGRQRHVLGHA